MRPSMTTTYHKEPRPHVVRLRVSQTELDVLREIAVEEQRTVANVLRLALRHFISERRVVDEAQQRQK
jgi:hypothetical protein